MLKIKYLKCDANGSNTITGILIKKKIYGNFGGLYIYVFK